MTDQNVAAEMDPSAAPPLMRRRNWLLATVAGVAVAGGVAFSLWRWRPDSIDPQPAEGIWERRFDAPDGSPLVMSSFSGKQLLLNFWATWCPPCIEELPLLDAFYGDHLARGWQVVGLAIDNPGSVRRFLQHTPVSFPVGLAGLDGAELIKALGNQAGGLPFTVVFNSNGRVRARKMGQLNPVDLRNWAENS